MSTVNTKTTTESRDERKAYLQQERLRLNAAWAPVAKSLPTHLELGTTSPAYQQRTEIGILIGHVEVELAEIALQEAIERRDGYRESFDAEVDSAAVEEARARNKAAALAAQEAHRAERIAVNRRSEHQHELRSRERAVDDAKARLGEWRAELARDQMAGGVVGH